MDSAAFTHCAAISVAEAPMAMSMLSRLHCMDGRLSNTGGQGADGHEHNLRQRQSKKRPAAAEQERGNM